MLNTFADRFPDYGARISADDVRARRRRSTQFWNMVLVPLRAVARTDHSGCGADNAAGSAHDRRCLREVATGSRLLRRRVTGKRSGPAALRNVEEDHGTPLGRVKHLAELLLGEQAASHGYVATTFPTRFKLKGTVRTTRKPMC